MSSLKRLKAANSLSDVADLLGYQAKALSYLIRVTPAASRYSEFQIPKRSGGTRTIHAPNAKLALLQSRLAVFLTECEREIAEQRLVHQHVAHGFRKEHSILTNAEVHRRRRFVLNVDLADFFGTIHFGRVRGYFQNNSDFQLKAEVALVLAQIVCHEAKLPQGSPCSPIISNFIGNILDVRLSSLARHCGCSYTRYADDLSFSTNRPNFPAALAIVEDATPAKWKVGVELEKAIKSSGFTVNHLKTRVQLSRSRQDVTGIVVNRFLNTPIEYRRTLRAMVHSYCTTGEFALKKTEPTVGKPLNGSPTQLQGMLGFAYQVEQWRSRGVEAVPGAQTAMERLLKRFLYYKEFAAPSLPAVVFEGKTDSVYLREAIRRSMASFPALASGAGKTFELKVKLHRESRVMKKLFSITSGGDSLKNFIKDYKSAYTHIEGPKGSNPVIVLMDNDEGFNSTKSLLTSFYKITLSPGTQVIHVFENLYVILSSPYGGAKHCIEDCFDPMVLATKLGSKSFSKSNDFDASLYYGKEWLAEKVVKPKSSAINFSGFSEILAGIQTIIATHPARLLVKTS